LPSLKADPLTPKLLADLCLSHLAENPELLGEFMVQTGYSPDSLRKSVGSDMLGRGLIDYFAQNEPLLLALCANSRISPESFMRVWAKLNPAG
jgi:hypothetical protein